MKTSISALVTAPSRSSTMVEAGRAITASATGSTCRAGLRLQVRAAVDTRDPREQIIHFGLCGCGNIRARLALRARGDHAALLQHIFPHRQSRAGLLLVTDQREVSVEEIVGGVAAALLG